MAIENEQDLIRRCQRGDVEAFHELYREYEAPMLRLAYRLTGNREEAEDLLQVAFTRAYRGLGTFRAEARFSTWLHRIVVNAGHDRRTRKPWKPVDLEAVPEGTSRDRPDLRNEVHRAIGALPERMRTCFVLHIQEGFKHREIAEMLGMKEGTVKRHVFDARVRLRSALAPEPGGHSR